MKIVERSEYRGGMLRTCVQRKQNPPARAVVVTLNKALANTEQRRCDANVRFNGSEASSVRVSNYQRRCERGGLLRYMPCREGTSSAAKTIRQRTGGGAVESVTARDPQFIARGGSEAVHRRRGV